MNLPKWSIDKYERTYFSQEELDVCKTLPARRVLPRRAFDQIETTINSFLKDYNVSPQEVIIAGSISVNLYVDKETEKEDPQWFKDCHYCKTLAGRKFKYSDIDLTIGQRPDLMGMYDQYPIKIDVGKFCNYGCLSYLEFVSKKGRL